MEYILDKIEEQLGVGISDSMFNKDIQQMKQIYQAPIRYDRVHNGYCYTEPGFSIKEFPLTHEEIEALDYSTALLHQLKGTKMFQQFENAINKVIEGYRVSKIIGTSEEQILQVEEPVKTEGSQWLEIVLKGIVEKTALMIRYKAFGKEEKKYTVSPYLLKEYRNRWYVVGHSKTANNVRVLALDRILSISSSKEKYVTETDFSSKEFFKYSIGITQLHNSRPSTVRLAFSAAEAPYIISQPLHHSQALIHQDDQHLIVEMTVYVTTELKMAILSYGPEVEVLQPASLRSEIEQLINRMAGVYSNQ